MLRSSAFGALGLLAGIYLSFAPGASQEELPLGWRDRQQRALEETRNTLVGSWTLLEFRHVANDLTGIQVAGYLGVTEDLLVFQVHTLEPETGPFGDPRRFQAGVHHWRLTPDLRLQTSSVLAHSNFAGGSLQFEPQLTTREYELLLLGEELQLIRSDGSVLRFTKLEPQPFPEAALQALDAASTPVRDEEPR